MVFVTEDAHGNGELYKLDSRLFRQQKGLTKKYHFANRIVS